MKKLHLQCGLAGSLAGLALLAACLAQAEEPGVPARYTVADLGALPGDDFSAAADVNASGQVVGVSFSARTAEHALLWDSGKLTDLGALGGMGAEATAINDRGQAA